MSRSPKTLYCPLCHFPVTHLSAKGRRLFLHPWCSAEKKRDRNYALAHRNMEHRRYMSRKWYAEHREQERARSRMHYELNKVHIQAQQKAARAKRKAASKVAA